jgi:hypothetical protein
MPRFFFALDDHSRTEDHDGTELGSIEEARTQAVMYACGWLRDHPDQIWDGQDMRVEVTDEQQRLLFSVVTMGIEAKQPRGS